jgi:hypothetical protein
MFDCYWAVRNWDAFDDINNVLIFGLRDAQNSASTCNTTFTILYSLMETALARLCHVILALCQHRQLPTDLCQSPNDLLITLCKPIDVVLNPRLGTKLLHHRLDLPQIVSWDSGEQVVYRLELKSTVSPIQPDGAHDIHGCS